MENKNNSENTLLTLENQKKLSMSNVNAVDGFSEQLLKLTVNGNGVYIYGENIKITSYSKSTGSLQAEGLFTSIKYGVKKVSFMKKVFK